MAKVIIMPKLGFTQEEGQLVQWYKKVGETVTKGETFFDVHTDKSVVSVEATDNGTVLKIVVEPDTTVPVFTPLAVVGNPGEDPDAALSAHVMDVAPDAAVKADFDTPAAESSDLIARARKGRLSPSEYNGGTFSISNLGMFGVDNFTAIINPPEAAILAVSSVKKTPVVITENGEDKVVIRPMMNITLSVDHRIIDGVLAAQFVGYIKSLLEDPMSILL